MKHSNLKWEKKTIQFPQSTTINKQLTKRNRKQSKSIKSYPAIRIKRFTRRGLSCLSWYNRRWQWKVQNRLFVLSSIRCQELLDKLTLFAEKMQWRRLIALTFKLFSNEFILDLPNVYCAPKFRICFSFFIILKLRFFLRLYLSFCIGLNHLFIILAQCFDRELWINNFNIWKHHFQNRIFFIDKRKK